VAQERGEAVVRAADLATARIADLRRDPHAQGVRTGTFEYSKGLEFKVVVLVGPDARAWLVDPYWMSADADREAWELLDRRKLFVAMTRARDRLLVLASDPLAQPVADGAAAFAEFDWR